MVKYVALRTAAILGNCQALCKTHLYGETAPPGTPVPKSGKTALLLSSAFIDVHCFDHNICKQKNNTN